MYKSGFVNGKYKTAPPKSQLHIDAVGVKEFETLNLLQADEDYIAQIALQNDGLSQDEVKWANERDRLQSIAVVKYNGHYFDMSPESSSKMVSSRESVKRRNKTLSWRCKDATTGENTRYNLGRTDMEAISDAVIDAVEVIDLAAETGFPVNPWPLEVS